MFSHVLYNKIRGTKTHHHHPLIILHLSHSHETLSNFRESRHYLSVLTKQLLTQASIISSHNSILACVLTCPVKPNLYDSEWEDLYLLPSFSSTTGVQGSIELNSCLPTQKPSQPHTNQHKHTHLNVKFSSFQKCTGTPLHVFLSLKWSPRKMQTHLLMLYFTN